MRFVDTNIFIRYLTQDDPQKAAACFRLFEQAKHNTVEITTSESVVAEIVFILSSARLYNLTRQEVRARLYPLLSLTGLKIPDRNQMLRALDLYATNKLDFEDAIAIAMMEQQGITEIYSYDRDFDSVQSASIQRLEP